jgi:hypothetical protein
MIPHRNYMNRQKLMNIKDMQSQHIVFFICNSNFAVLSWMFIERKSLRLKKYPLINRLERKMYHKNYTLLINSVV